MLTQSRFCSLPTELVNPNCAPFESRCEQMFAIYSSDNAAGRDSKNSEIMASFKTTTPVSALAPFKDSPCRAVASAEPDS